MEPFRSLDFIYTPVEEVDDAAARWVGERGGQRLAIYELTRPDAAAQFDGRIDD